MKHLAKLECTLYKIEPKTTPNLDPKYYLMSFSSLGYVNDQALAPTNSDLDFQKVHLYETP